MSASEFARLTGVSRERLRTWERRHGFPRPLRPGGAGARRYALADVERVIGVRRAIDEGVPVARAIEATRGGRAEAGSPSAATLAAVSDWVGAPITVISGPEPVRVRYLNRAARALAGAPEPGTVLDDLAPDGVRALRRAFALSRPARTARPSWHGGRAVPVTAVPLPARPGEPPAVALIDFEAAAEQDLREDLQRAAAERDEAAGRASRLGHLLETCTLVADRLRELPGLEALPQATDLLVRRLGAVDVALAPYMAGQLVFGRSSRGVLGPEVVTVAAHGDLASLVREGRVRWLRPESAAAFGVPDGLHALASSVVVGGEPLAVLLLLFDGPLELDGDLARALEVVVASLGLALMQQRLMGAEAA